MSAEKAGRHRQSWTKRKRHISDKASTHGYEWTREQEIEGRSV